MRLPAADVKVFYVEFGGGLDLETPVLSVKPGACLSAVNYEPGPSGGYRRIDGYERFDGRTSPSSATYLYAPIELYASQVSRLGTATRVDEDGLIVSVPVNTPRINHDPVTLADEGILIEAAATNFALYNTQLDNAEWARTNANVTVDAVMSPSGAIDAELIFEDATAAALHLVRSSAVTARWPTAGAGNATYSIFVKQGPGTRKVHLYVVDRDGNAYWASFDPTTGALGGSGGSPVATAAEEWGNSWWRFSITVPIGVGATVAYASVRLATGHAAGDATYGGDGASGLYLWGPQVEAGDAATSLVFTAATAVTRNADVVVNKPAAVGQRVFGRTSGAVGTISTLGADYLGLTVVSGTFVNGDEIVTTGGVLPLIIGLNDPGYAKGILTSAPVAGGAPTGALDATMLADAADIYRAFITAVPGSGPVRGIHVYKGVVYAMRDNVAGTAGQILKSSSTGWRQIPLHHELAFTSGGTTEISDGDVVTGATSGTQATVLRVVLETGDWASGTAAGRLILQTPRWGAFVAENLNVGAATNLATVAGDATQITLLPGGRYECENYNFSASVDKFRIYGCDGVNRGFELDDADVYVPIRTGMAVDTPLHMTCHKQMLFFSFRGSSQNSGISTPYEWTTVSGANEIGVGDNITGYQVQGGDALLIFARNKSSQLLGSSVADFVLNPLSNSVGAVPYTIQEAILVYHLDDRGVMQAQRTQAFGNFSAGSITRSVQSVVDSLRSVAVASSVYRSRDQYRIYGSDGTGIIIALDGDKVKGITTLEYPIAVTCAAMGEDATGKDVVFIGDDDGFVYQADKGSSFDGEEIQAYLILPFNDLKSPRLRKRFRKVAQEMSAVGYAEIRFQPIFNYGDSDVAAHRFLDAQIQGAGGYYDVALWDTIYYDAKMVSQPEFDVNGTGNNMGMIYYSNSRSDLGHTIQSALVHFSPRRLSR